MVFPVPRKPHDTRNTGGVATVASINDTMMISNGDQRVWLQGGQVYDESGKLLEGDDVPSWFNAEYNKVHPRMKRVHPTDGSLQDTAARQDRQQEIAELRSKLSLLEAQELNAEAAGGPIGEGGSKLPGPNKAKGPITRANLGQSLNDPDAPEPGTPTNPVEGNAVTGRLGQRDGAPAPTEEDPEMSSTHIGTTGTTTEEADDPDAPNDETDEEALHKSTKEELAKIADDEDIEGVSTKDTKDVMIQKILDGRASKSE